MIGSIICAIVVLVVLVVVTMLDMAFGSGY